jgi:hypothetical protein
MSIKIILAVGLFLSVIIPALSQDQKTLEYLRQEEQRKKSEILRELDSGVYFMDIGAYEVADKRFRHVLENVRSVPSDLTFYFGKNSFYLKKYKQSIDWVTKYIQLKGTGGQYYSEASDILNKSEAEVLKSRASDGKRAEEVFSQNYDIDCGPAGKVTCPVCKGDHVIIKAGPFGDEYKTCPYCNDHGLLTCEEYNKLLRGELAKKQ